jgi:hypothetical protein
MVQVLLLCNACICSSHAVAARDVSACRLERQIMATSSTVLRKCSQSSNTHTAATATANGALSFQGEHSDQFTRLQIQNTGSNNNKNANNDTFSSFLPQQQQLLQLQHTHSSGCLYLNNAQSRVRNVSTHAHTCLRCIVEEYA